MMNEFFTKENLKRFFEDEINEKKAVFNLEGVLEKQI